MAVASAPRTAGIPSRKTRARRARPTRSRRLVRFGQRALLVLMALPLALRVVVIAIVLLVLWSVVNWTYQVVRKPTELFFPVSGALSKTPPETWRSYETLFRAHSTAIIAPELLAALAQAEGAGNRVAGTCWRWRLSWNPFEWYQPASSAVGMYQITTPTFREARRYCIHYHEVVEEGRWYQWRSCWFNVLYTRVLPSHAVEMTSALLDRNVASAVALHRATTATLQQKQDLAAVIHLCCARGCHAFAPPDFRLTPGQKCGDHDVRGYLSQINTMKRLFSRLAALD